MREARAGLGRAAGLSACGWSIHEVISVTCLRIRVDRERTLRYVCMYVCRSVEYHCKAG